MTTSDTNWDLGSFFPAFGSPEHRRFVSELFEGFASTRSRAATLGVLSSESGDDWEAVALAYEDLRSRRSHLSAYVESLAALDASNVGYQNAASELGLIEAELDKLRAELRRGIGGASDASFDAWTARERLQAVRYPLARLRRQARESMSAELEGLAADLGTDGLAAWGRLYARVAGTLDFELVEPDGSVKLVPMARRRSLSADANRARRAAAFEGGNRAWARAAPVLGAALNHIAGARLTLNAHRGVDHFLDVALFQAAISRETLDAMWAAVEARRDVPRRALAIKARALGLAQLAWYDLEAPLPLPSAKTFDWASATESVARAFGRAYPRLAEFFRASLARRWVEYEPREHKLPGAFCTWSTLTGEPRVFMSFGGSLGDVSTLAHESGHAFHSTLLAPLRPLIADAPMTLAETASTFAQQLLAAGLASDPSVDDATRALLLGTIVNEISAFCLDIPARFAFEHAFYEERARGEVGVARLCELVQKAQERIFGPVLESGDPYFWASKPHFFTTDVTFYNFPYTFGYLLSRGLYAAFEREGPAFLERYERLLAATGRGDAHDVVREITGFDLTRPEFWQTAIASFEAPLDELEALLPKLGLPAV